MKIDGSLISETQVLYDEVMKENACPFTKIFRLAGTPHMGAVLIVLFTILGFVTYVVVEFLFQPDRRFEKVVKQLNALSDGRSKDAVRKTLRDNPMTNGPASDPDFFE